MPTCTKCHKKKPIGAFYKRKYRKKKINSWCKRCVDVLKQEWHRLNPEKHMRYSHNYQLRLKSQTFQRYGNGGEVKCKCCGEKEIKFLAIDHLRGGGNKERAKLKRHNRGGIGFYQWLKNNNFPDGYQILCHNCNSAKGSWGKCPHEI